MCKPPIPRISISIGDFNGIGPEIVFKFLQEVDLNQSTPVVLSPEAVVEQVQSFLSLDALPLHRISNVQHIQDGKVNVLSLEPGKLPITPGIQSAESGKTAMHSIEACIELCMKDQVQAMVTAPISKEAVNLAGYKIPGHTEFLAEKTGAKDVLMMLVSGSLRVALVSTHIPIREVASALTPERIRTKVMLLANSLREDFAIEKPKIAVLGLNPHAGDGGVIGQEEIEIIEPLLDSLKEELSDVILHGPYPADGFFGQQLHLKHDGILAMYHDQGLAPFKLLSFGKGVNFTAGLPIIRTSPDHGTAFDIAGKGIANPSSFKEAYTLATELANKRLREH